MSASWRISRMKFYEIERKKFCPKCGLGTIVGVWVLLFYFDERKSSRFLWLWREVEKIKTEHFSETHGTTRLVRRALASATAEKSLTARASHLIVCRCFAFFGRSRPIDTRINYNPNLWAKKHRQARNLPRIIDQQQPKLFERMKIPQRHTEGAKAR